MGWHASIFESERETDSSKSFTNATMRSGPSAGSFLPGTQSPMTTVRERKLLSPRDLAQAIGSSESSVKRWTDQGLLKVTRTAGGHRRIATSDAIQYIRQNACPVVKPEILGLPASLAGEEPEPVDSSTAKPNDTFLELLQSGHDVGARNHVLSRFLAGESVASLADGPMRTAMEVIGASWEHGPEGIYVEHRATEICAGLLRDLRSYVSPMRPLGRAIGGAISGDPYRLPPLAVAATLAECGLQTVNLGANTPIEVLEEASIGSPPAERPKVVWICVSVITNPDGLGESIQAFSNRCREHDMLLAIGGRDSHQIGLPTQDHVIHGDTLELLSRSVTERLAGLTTGPDSSTG